ncbi:MAG: S-layer family protein, partial [Coleofasciculus sp. S288]|nr:S-layer family protein [Coleofasciculus sp. S288]
FNPTGDAGNINVTTGRLIVRDEATVNVESTGVGDAGIIRVVADAIALDNRGSIDASTGSGAGGNINLQAQDILLRRRSRIATNAGNSTGGNIMIDIDTLVAVPVEDSDITANAQQGVGGRVSITAQGIFGTQFRERVTPESDITATSELGPQFSGIVEIDIRGIDPARGLVELPDAIIDPSDRIATGCPADEGNSFAVTGRGGLPEDPTATLRGRTLWQDVRNLSEFGGQSRMASTMGNEQLTNNNQPIIEAQGWAIDANGQVVLVADASQVTSHSAWQKPTQCYQSNSL